MEQEGLLVIVSKLAGRIIARVIYNKSCGGDCVHIVHTVVKQHSLVNELMTIAGVCLTSSVTQTQ